MKMTFLGGADEIGASSILLEIAGKRFLIDAGIRMQECPDRGKHPDFSQIDTIDACFLTHAHTDHSGALPVVNKYTKHIPVYMTHGSFQLCTVLYKDAIKIMQIFTPENEIPLYTETEVENTFKNIRQIDFSVPFLIDNVKITFFPAGHILGASCISFESKEGNVLFAGDFSVTNQLASAGASVCASPDIVVTETTYGGKTHINRKMLEYECVLKAKEILERNGKILIPAFAIGRSQEMILLLKSAMTKQIIPEVNIYVDGMINSVNLVYENNPSGLPDNLKAVIKNKQSLFYTNYIKRVIPSMRKKIIKAHSPSIIISSSGMLMGGPSVFYAKEMLVNENNALFISGYQDEESPGRKLLNLKTKDTIKLENKEICVHAEIYKFSFSAHADENQIISFTNALNPDQIVLVHGETEARKAFSGKFVCKNLHLPVLNESIEFKIYRNKIFTIELEKSKEKMTIERYWRKCLISGIDRIPIMEVVNLFPGENETINKFGGFIRDYKDKKFFIVLSPEKRDRYLKRKTKFESAGNLKNKMFLYGTQNGVNLAFCLSVSSDHFAYHVLSTKKKKSRTRVDIEKVIHVFNYKELMGKSETEIIEILRVMKASAKLKEKSFRKILLEGSKEYSLEKAKQVVNAKDIIDEIALLLALVPVSKINETGIFYIRKQTETGSQGKEITKKPDKYNTNELIKKLKSALKGYSVKKVSYKNYTFILNFDFPDAVDKKEVLCIARKKIPSEDFSIEISDSVNQAAFSNLLFDVLGPYGKISIYIDKKQVEIKHHAIPVTDGIKETFLKKTGFSLVEKAANIQNQSNPVLNQQEIISRTKMYLPNEYRDSVKIGIKDQTIILKTDFPDVLLKKVPDITEKIKKEIGFDVDIKKYPNTHKLIQILKENFLFQGDPSINLEERIVKIKCSSIDKDLVEKIKKKTGFRIIAD